MLADPQIQALERDHAVREGLADPLEPDQLATLARPRVLFACDDRQLSHQLPSGPRPRGSSVLPENYRARLRLTTDRPFTWPDCNLLQFGSMQLSKCNTGTPPGVS